MKRLAHKLLLRLLPLLPAALSRLLYRIPGVRLPAMTVLIQKQDALLAGRLQNAAPSFFQLVSSPCSVKDQMEIVFNKRTSFAGERVALVAHWDPDNRVDPYVLYYLAALRRLGYATALVTACPGLRHTDSLGECCDAFVVRHCEGYDFTSWKGALEALPGVARAQGLVLTNDSVFGPVNPLERIHAAMDRLECDYWGLLESEDRLPHLQSFYLVFRSSALMHPSFHAFWSKVDTNPDKEHVISAYELVLAASLSQQGLCGAACLPAACLPKTWIPGHNYPYWRQLIRYAGYPFVKRDILAGKYSWLNIQGWERELERLGYPSTLITGYFARVGA